MHQMNIGQCSNSWQLPLVDIFCSGHPAKALLHTVHCTLCYCRDKRRVKLDKPAARKNPKGLTNPVYPPLFLAVTLYSG